MIDSTGEKGADAQDFTFSYDRHREHRGNIGTLERSRWREL
ncbi:hypothetical protein [Agrobacterium vitis]|nr:hypothetical protein [Agrobacterium vitis]